MNHREIHGGDILRALPEGVGVQNSWPQHQTVYQSLTTDVSHLKVSQFLSYQRGLTEMRSYERYNVAAKVSIFVGPRKRAFSNKRPPLPKMVSNPETVYGQVLSHI